LSYCNSNEEIGSPGSQNFKPILNVNDLFKEYISKQNFSKFKISKALFPQVSIICLNLS